MDSKSGWITVPIKEVAQVFDGPHATPKTVDKGPIFLGINSLSMGRLDLSNTRYVTEKDFILWTRRITPRAKDIVFSYETRIGEAAIIPEGLKCCLGRRMALVRTNPDKLDPKFFLYSYLSPRYQEFLKSKTIHGSTVERLPLTDFPEFPISFPPLPEQKFIVATLSCLDEKIELNQRMNETLEAMAQALFKSWFVDFDPVKAKSEGREPEGMDDTTAALFPSSFSESPIGLIPEGWRTGDIQDLCQRVESGGTPSRKERGYWDNGTIPWLTSSEVRQKVILDTKEKITERGLAESNAKIWPSMSTVVAMYGATAGQVTLLANSVSANQACCALVPKSYAQSFVFLKTARSVEIYESQARGSAQQNLNKSIVSELKTIVPPQKILEGFENVVSSLIVLIIQGVKENMILTELRDLLLPRLISGKLRVGEISETVEALAL